ncbi:MAG: nascent polypeptide-associated complex protein [Candidatus Methanomethylicia archaeon]
MPRFSMREAKRLAQRIGLNIEEVSGVREVILKFDDKELIIQNPHVTLMNYGGEKFYQVSGEETERLLESKKETIPDEDIRLVAYQAGVSFEEAKKALIETEGDLARAILLLKSK